MKSGAPGAHPVPVAVLQEVAKEERQLDDVGCARSSAPCRRKEWRMECTPSVSFASSGVPSVLSGSGGCGLGMGAASASGVRIL